KRHRLDDTTTDVPTRRDVSSRRRNEGHPNKTAAMSRLLAVEYCGEVISEHEHVTAILNGLSSESKAIVTVITASQVSYGVQAITTMLLNAEARLQTTLVDVSSSANMVTTRSVDFADSTQQPPYRPNSAPGRGRGCGCSSSSHIQCQLYGKTGHLVDHCYHQFDITYKSTAYY
ncbi:hypothetical protein Goklo_017934, partial [Gossypium klotzschianum]|nr:hypothetical protein [Gossypium klotzschianum]